MKTAAQKMQLKAGYRALLVNAPENALDLLGGLPDGAQVVTGGPADWVLLFAHHLADLEAHLPGLRAALAQGGLLWVAYHKGSSPVKTNINRDSIWAYARTIGLDAVAQVSVDEDWSAIRLKIA